MYFSLFFTFHGFLIFSVHTIHNCGHFSQKHYIRTDGLIDGPTGNPFIISPLFPDAWTTSNSSAREFWCLIAGFSNEKKGSAWLRGLRKTSCFLSFSFLALDSEDWSVTRVAYNFKRDTRSNYQNIKLSIDISGYRDRRISIYIVPLYNAVNFSSLYNRYLLIHSP